MSTTWSNPWDFPRPSITDPGVEEADQMLADNIRACMNNAGLNFLPASGTPDEQYSSPQAFLENILSYAVYLKHGYADRQYASATWDPIKQGFKAGYAALDFLKKLPVNKGDESTLSIYDAWVAKTGQLYGGHPTSAAPVVPQPTNTGYDGPPSIFGGKQ